MTDTDRKTIPAQRIKGSAPFTRGEFIVVGKVVENTDDEKPDICSTDLDLIGQKHLASPGEEEANAELIAAAFNAATACEQLGLKYRPMCGLESIRHLPEILDALIMAALFIDDSKSGIYREISRRCKGALLLCQGDMACVQPNRNRH